MPAEGLGEFHISAKENQWTLSCAALAYDGLYGHKPLMLLSGVGPSTTVKAVSAVLSSRSAPSLFGFIPDFLRPDEHLARAEFGYDVYRSKLGYDQWQLLAVAREPSLIAAYSREALWQHLSGERFTTPLLESWLPFIEERLTARNMLRPLRCWNCDCHRLTLVDNVLDEIVSEGVRNKQLKLVA